MKRELWFVWSICSIQLYGCGCAGPEIDIQEAIQKMLNISGEIDLFIEEVLAFDVTVQRVISEELTYSNTAICSLNNALAYSLQEDIYQFCSQDAQLNLSIQNAASTISTAFTDATVQTTQLCNDQQQIMNAIGTAIALNQEKLKEIVVMANAHFINQAYGGFNRIFAAQEEQAHLVVHQVEDNKKQLISDGQKVSDVVTNIGQDVELLISEQGTQLVDPLVQIYRVLLSKLTATQAQDNQIIKEGISRVETEWGLLDSTNKQLWSGIKTEQQEIMQPATIQLTDLYTQVQKLLTGLGLQTSDNSAIQNKELCAQTEVLLQAIEGCYTISQDNAAKLTYRVQQLINECCAQGYTDVVDALSDTERAIVEAQLQLMQQAVRRVGSVASLLVKKAAQMGQGSAELEQKVITRFQKIQNQLDCMNEQITEEICRRLDDIQTSLIQGAEKNTITIQSIRSFIVSEICKKLSDDMTELIVQSEQFCYQIQKFQDSIQTQFNNRMTQIEALRAVKNAEITGEFNMFAAYITNLLTVLISNSVSTIMQQQFATAEDITNMEMSILDAIASQFELVQTTETNEHAGALAQFAAIQAFISASDLALLLQMAIITQQILPVFTTYKDETIEALTALSVLAISVVVRGTLAVVSLTATVAQFFFPL